MKNKIFAAAFFAFIFFTPVQATENDYILIAQNQNFELYADPQTNLFYVQERGARVSFHARPVDWEEDGVALGINRQLMSSLISIRALDFNHVERIFAGTSAERIFREIPNGFEVEHNFIEQGVTVLVQIVLTDFGFQASLPINGIIERGPQTLTQVQLLPFFGAGQSGESGYALLPDGSGTLIDFDVIFTMPNEINRPIYGFDAAMPSIAMSNPDQVWRLPVFGIKRDDAAFLAVINEGAAVTTLSARVAGDTSQYFRIMPNLVYRARHTMVLFQNSANERTLLSPSPRRLREGLSVDYILLAQEANYSTMALAYREYLLERGRLVRQDTTPFLELTLIGATRANRTFLGVPYRSLQPLTTFSEAELIIKSFNEQGVNNIALNLFGYNRGGIGEYFDDRLRPARVLGGRRGLNNLLELENNNLSITYVGELLSGARAGQGFSSSRHAARNISGGIAEQFFFNIVTRQRDYRRPPGLILSPALLEARANGFYASLQNGNINSVMPLGLGSSIHGDYGSRAFTTRDESAIYWENAIAASGLDFVADGGNAYVFPYSRRISGVPMRASGFRLTTREVPFYQLVINGFIPYSGEAGNMYESQRDGFLRTIEYGAYPRFELFYAESSAIRDTDIQILSGNYLTWISEAAQSFNAAREIYAAMGGSSMLKHEEIEPDVFMITYENGAFVLVNYKNEAAYFSSLEVPPKWYAIGNSNGF